jgi:L-threonylcarbamoyladenylate synthase
VKRSAQRQTAGVVEKHRQHARVAPTHTPELFRLAVKEAAELLRRGELVALPTETVYGLAANALDPGAVAKLFSIKGRPLQNPMIVHVASEAMVRTCVREWPPTAHDLCRSFWPGPLTLVLPRAAQIPDVVTGGGDTVGVRWPNHPFILAVIRECGFPLAAPSANPANRVSPTTAAHVLGYFADSLPLIVDGGQSRVGIESTVLDLSVAPARVLRPGIIHDQALGAVLGQLATNSASSAAILKSPGQFKKHYSPRAKLLLRQWDSEEDLLAQARTLGPLDQVHIIVHTRIPSGQAFGRVSVIPHDAEAFARAIYAELHQSDLLGAQYIIVEALPEGPEWQGIADRLSRAAAC